MRVMIYLGSATPRIVNGLKSMSDEVDYCIYTSVGSFVQDADLRHLSFNRVIFNSKFVSGGEDDFRVLNEFISKMSSSTELVMVINNGDTISESMFQKYFTSPIHTCAIVKGAASMDFFQGIVTLPIPDVKARYYTLDKSYGSSVTARELEDQQSLETAKIENFAETEEKVSGDTNYAQTTSNVKSFVSSEYEDFKPAYPTETTSNVYTEDVNGILPKEEEYENPTAESDAVYSGIPSSSGVEDFSEYDEDDILSVGSYGSVHSDTGLFEEDDLEEGHIEAEPVNSEPVCIEEHSQERYEPVLSGDYASEGSSCSKSTPESYEMGSYKIGAINIVTNTSGSVSAQKIIDDAVMLSSQGNRVLIVDMDFECNSILSFIDITKFYKSGARTFSLSNIYEEDGVHIVSCGYGGVALQEDISSVLCNCIGAYNIVIVSCPVGSIGRVDEKILKSSNIIVVSGNDPCQIVETSLALTDRNKVSLCAERLIMGSRSYIILGGRTELVDETIRNMFFANGCWLG